ncbi:MAG: hypothetical protein L0I24_21670 [Pseudonocardia sp.]|nr:hypothetical protein [Pseudonocardia sp.]
MTFNQAGSIFALGLRLTKLDASGAPLVGTDTCYVTEALVSINLGLEYSEPDAIELMNGRGATCLYYQPHPTVRNGMIEELKVCYPDPNILQFLAGGERITSGGVNEVQTVTLTGATGGTFTLTFQGQTTGAIAHNATAAVVTTALTALSNINPGDVAVTGTGPYVVTFAGQYAATNLAQMAASGTNLTGTTPSVAVATTTAGVVGNDTIGWRPPSVNVDPIPNGVAIEAWSNAVLNNSIGGGALPYWHWVIPKAQVRPSEAMTLGSEDPATPQMEGWTEESTGFGTGPRADIAFPTDRVWQFCQVATLPNLTPGFVEVTA